MRLLKPHELVKAIADLQSRVAVLEAGAASPAASTADEDLCARVSAIEEALDAFDESCTPEAEKPKAKKPKAEKAKKPKAKA